jgi:hypothetical protein
MQEINGKPDNWYEEDDSRAPLPSVWNKLILDSHSQKDDLKQYVIEEDSDLCAEDTQDDHEDDLVVEPDIFEVGVLRGPDGGQLVHQLIDYHCWEGAQETLQEGAHHEIGRGELHREEDTTDRRSKGNYSARAYGCWKHC